MLRSRLDNLKPLVQLAAATAVVLVAAGCAPTYHDYEAFVAQPRPIVTATEYRVAPPDAITIYSKRVREINNLAQTIRPDGVVVLPLLGEMNVAGKTCKEISDEMQALAATYYDDADVAVRVSTFASKKIYVFGEVTQPGPYAYNGANTVLGTLASAQPSRIADPGRISIMRPNAKGELIRRMTVDLDEMVKRGDTSLDAVLEEGDIIYVPPNPLAKVGLAVGQILLPIQPAAQTVTGAETIRGGDLGYGQ